MSYTSTSKRDQVNVLKRQTQIGQHITQKHDKTMTFRILIMFKNNKLCINIPNLFKPLILNVAVNKQFKDNNIIT